MTAGITGPKDDWLLGPHQLQQAPELALLAVLDRSLEITAHAVLVAHPELSDTEPPPYWRPPDLGTHCAEALLRVAGGLRRALSLYRIAVLRALPPAEPPDAPAPGEEDIPF